MCIMRVEQYYVSGRRMEFYWRSQEQASVVQINVNVMEVWTSAIYHSGCLHWFACKTPTNMLVLVSQSICATGSVMGLVWPNIVATELVHSERSVSFLRGYLQRAEHSELLASHRTNFKYTSPQCFYMSLWAVGVTRGTGGHAGRRRILYPRT